MKRKYGTMLYDLQLRYSRERGEREGGGGGGREEGEGEGEELGEGKD